MMPEGDIFICKCTYIYGYVVQKCESIGVECCSQQLQSGLGGVAATCGRSGGIVHVNFVSHHGNFSGAGHLIRTLRLPADFTKVI